VVPPFGAGRWWKLFSPGVEPAKFSQAGMMTLVSPQMATRVDE